MLIAGEASGDLHASHLITAIKGFDKDASFCFFGGDLMAKAAGISPEVHYHELNVMGFVQVINHLPRLLKNLERAKKLIDSFKPDVLILVDYPGFNLKLARYAYSQGVRTDYYISPKVWAWKERRVNAIKKYISHLYSILPFEVPFFKKHGYDVTYVGNPSVKEVDYALAHVPPRKHFFEKNCLGDPEKHLIALLPGSRRSEIKKNLPVMLQALEKFPDHPFAVAMAPSVDENFYHEVAGTKDISLIKNATVTLLKYSHAALVTSGTATLETALAGTPQVVCYRGNGSQLFRRIMEKVLKVKYVSLPNLIVGNHIVPELLLNDCNPKSIIRELKPLLYQPAKRDWQKSGYKTMRHRLGNSDAAEYAAELIYDSLENSRH